MGDSTSKPHVTVVIPCRNERDFIIPCIQTVLQSDYPADKLHIAVVDGMSTDGTRETINQHFAHDNRVQLMHNEKKTTPYALNIGIRSSNSKYVMILGAHSEVDSDYINRAVDHLENSPNIGCAGGRLKSISSNRKSEVIAKAMSSAFGVGTSHFRTGLVSGYVDTVAFGVYRRTLLDEIGYFDEDLARNQDDEMSYRILKSGYKIYLDTHTAATYYVRNSFQKLAAQQFQYGYWKVYVNRKHQAITTLRQLIPLFFLLYIISLPFCLWVGIVWLTPLILYLIVSLIVSLKLSAEVGEVFTLLYVFPTIHLSYGYGYLLGIVDFLLLRKKQTRKHERLTR